MFYNGNWFKFRVPIFPVGHKNMFCSCFLETFIQGILKMNIQSAISREIFVPRDEKLLVSIEVRRRTKRKGLSFLKAGGKKDYLTYLCLSGNVCLHKL